MVIFHSYVSLPEDMSIEFWKGTATHEKNSDTKFQDVIYIYLIHSEKLVERKSRNNPPTYQSIYPLVI
jgi:hypothetical protein